MPIDVTEGLKRDVLEAAEAPGSAGAEPKGSAVDDEKKLLADLWMRQTDIFLKLVSLMPVIELGILAGWYKLMKDQRNDIALIAAVLGVIVMLIAWTYLYRATKYISYFKDQVPILKAVPKTTLTTLLGSKLRLLGGLSGRQITGRNAGLCVPALCAGVNLLLAIGSPFIVLPPNPN
jgi:hypothetical protein